MARRFKVSRDVIYRKFLDRKLVSQGEYEAAVAYWTQQAQQASGAQSGGGDYYNTQIAYLGRDYINLAFSQYYQNRIDEAKLADYLNIAPKYVGTLEARLQRRRA